MTTFRDRMLELAQELLPNDEEDERIFILAHPEPDGGSVQLVNLRQLAREVQGCRNAEEPYRIYIFRWAEGFIPLTERAERTPFDADSSVTTVHLTDPSGAEVGGFSYRVDGHS